VDTYNLKPSDVTAHNVAFGIHRIVKNVRQKASLHKASGPQTVVLILGCQRSGTSLTYWIFERDFNTKIYRESSSLSSQDTVERLRLNPLPEIRETIARHDVPLVVMKPLVESQRARELLQELPGSKVLWLYRHYQDVASSNLKAFGMDNGISDIRPIALGDESNWRAQNATEETRAIIRRFFADDMNPYDAAALFWYVRNRLFFDQGLDRDPQRAMLCRYEDLAVDPAGMMRRVYAFIGTPYPGDGIVQDVHPQSVGKGKKIALSPEVEQLCNDLLERMERLNEERLPVPVQVAAG
jgi:hypothetical protein